MGCSRLGGFNAAIEAPQSVYGSRSFFLKSRNKKELTRSIYQISPGAKSVIAAYPAAVPKDSRGYGLGDDIV